MTTGTARPQREVMVHIQGLEAGYGSRMILKGVSLEVRQGEFWCFLGPNGQGKTTLFSVLLGTLKPMRGEIRLHSAFGTTGGMAFIPQRCDMDPALRTTVREFTFLGLTGLRLNRHDRANRLEWALDSVGLRSLSGEEYWNLSGGQRQRALVARALIRRPGILLVDEPTSGLDLAAEGDLLRSLDTLNRRDGLTILFVTHSLAHAEQYASHVALLHQGCIESGPVVDMLTQERLSKMYGAGFLEL